ncbi:MAG: hypothetical protein BZ135_01650 [Methanosphaera sp. rholeuAM6]|nr:MAG: hypothetical protein BZ135_01650 [Methanosphaera sp. rholeuAM6]
MNESIGKRLKKLRLDNNYSQNEVAKYLGISQSLLAKIESDKRNINLNRLLMLCDLYNVDEEYLLYAKGSYDKDNFSFRKDTSRVNLETIASMNKLVKNIKLMNTIIEEDKNDKK